jgi:hypothetical protein
MRNLWNNGTVSWSMSDPGITGTAVLANNETVLIFIASNYTQGDKTPTLNATISTASASIADHFKSKPLALTNLLTLTDGPNAVSEMDIQNYAGSSQNVSWQFNTGQENITGTTALNTSVLVFIQNNYTTSGVYRTFANISNQNYVDNRTGAIVQ